MNILKIELRILADLCFYALRNVLGEKKIDEHFSHPHFNNETFYANRLSKHSWENQVHNQNLYFARSPWLKNVSQKNLWKVADVWKEWRTGLKSSWLFTVFCDGVCIALVQLWNWARHFVLFCITWSGLVSTWFWFYLIFLFALI